jgi:hypothetical protein
VVKSAKKMGLSFLAVMKKMIMALLTFTVAIFKAIVATLIFLATNPIG